jgi:hypothetical protein
MKKKILIMLFAICLTIIIYVVIIMGIELCFFIAYKIRVPIRGFVDFSITLGIYYKYILPYILLFINMMFSVSKYKVMNFIIAITIYIVFIAWFWGSYLTSLWPYRVIPILSILSLCYWLDVFIINKFLEKIK